MTKRRFRINAGRYGGEVTIGEINPDFVEHYAYREQEDIINAVDAWENSETLEEYAQETDDAPPLTSDGVDGFRRPWSDISELEHVSSAYADGTWSWCEVPGDGSDDFRAGDEHDFEAYQIAGREAYNNSDLPEPTDYLSQEEIDDYIPVLCYHSSQKGSFGDWFVETDGEDFDPRLLAFAVLETPVCELIDRVWYNGVELELNQDYADSWGKGTYVSVGYMNPNYHDTVAKTLDSEEYMEEIWNDFWRDLAEERGESSE